MKRIVEKYAFRPPEPSYGEKDVNFLYRINGTKIPYLYYKRPNDGNIIYTVLYTHANAEDIGQLKQLAEVLVYNLPINFLMYDFKGYGHNNGRPSELSCYKDIKDIYKFLTENENIPSNQIILYGRSIGTGSTIELASKLNKKNINLGGIILESPFTSVMDVFSKYLNFIPFTNIFINSKKIHTIKNPILILHGNIDTIIPYSHSLKLYNKCSHKYATLKIIDNGDHQELFKYHSQEILHYISKFIKLIKHLNL